MKENKAVVEVAAKPAKLARTERLAEKVKEFDEARIVFGKASDKYKLAQIDYAKATDEFKAAEKTFNKVRGELIVLQKSVECCGNREK